MKPSWATYSSESKAFKPHFVGGKLFATASRPGSVSLCEARTGRYWRSEIWSGSAWTVEGSSVPLRKCSGALALALTTTRGGSWNLPRLAGAVGGQV